MARFAVVGHVEWMVLGRFAHVPEPGEIIDATWWTEEVCSSAAVAAVQLARLSGTRVAFFTALGADERGRRSRERLEELGVEVLAAERDEPQRHGFCHLDDAGERTLSIVGSRLAPHGADDLPWARLDDVDAVFLSGADPAAVTEARRARRLVATPRAAADVATAGVRLDALVGSAEDRLEQGGDALDPPPALVVRTRGGEGGDWSRADGSAGSWAGAPLPAPRVDSYGAGDTFAAAFTFGTGAGWELDATLEFAARCGAANLTGRGPYGASLPTPPSR
jgi:ribokinase